MNPKPLKYISYFDFQDSSVQRGYVPAATNKIESICQILNECGYEVEIVSMSAVTESKFKLYSGQTVERRKGLKLKTFFSWGGKNKCLKRLKVVWHLVAMFFYLLLHTRKDEPVLVYHSLGYFNVILWAKRLRKFKMILEVEEIYQDVGKAKYGSMEKYEYAMIEAADAYIFPTVLLDKKLNPSHKPHAIIHGTYTVELPIIDKFDDGRIHVVYAGTFDPRKGGGAAAAAAAFLPKHYHLHVCGFGSDEDREQLLAQITKVAAESEATISFDGLKKGREYIAFIQRCHIGLSTQDPSAAFNATSFPSKILSYMANGLSVVSIDIPTIRTSDVGANLTYYERQTPQEIARAILRCELQNNNRQVISRLRQQFSEEINQLICQL